MRTIMEKLPKILIVDDNKVNVELLRSQLKPYPYDIEVSFDGEDALEKIQRMLPDLVLLDLMMPKISGFEICRSVKQNKDTQFIPVIVITALQELDDKIKAIELGADDFLVKPINRLELTTRIKSLLHLKALHDDLDTSENILFSLAGALEAKDFYTKGHSDRVAEVASLIARKMGLSERDLDAIRKGSLLHDIGKIGVKESILLKPDKLTDEEMAHIKSHPKRGYDICSPLRSIEQSLPIIRSHHERIDGEGYPDGLKGEKIPLLAKIIAIADAFDAMTTDRPYRKGMSKEQALKIFENELNSGQWDPKIVKIFIKMMHEQE
ncbi:MAG: two-component system response regulator [Deltaproteobacteria bacterium CG07_land_8_20_14_0_80_38_7]|nr:MAG: two-component system response regulator [Deltaproteobacteria bacterium CG07_land_8_20_14_0_80_38_7]